MKTVVNGKPAVVNLLGKQNAHVVTYRLMRYVLRRRCADGTLLHNVITGQLVFLSKEESNLLDRLPLSYMPVMQSLIEDYFLVPVDFAEKKTVHELRALMQHLFSRKGINNYLILTTTNCNARCAYCFEEGVRRINMSASTAEKVIDYIADHRDRKTVKLHWFGGEPLVCADRIDQICVGLAEKNVDYISFMTSNGYLLSEKMLRRAANLWNLRAIQITLDGTEDVYNKVKNYISAAESPFQRVMTNIGLLLDAGIQVVLRLNLDHQNADNLSLLIDYLSKTFKHREKLTIYVSRIIDELCTSSVVNKDNNSDLDLQLDRLKCHILDSGISMPEKQLLSIKTNSCMADSDEALVIHPDGSISKCESIQDQNTFGHIASKNVDKKKRNTFKETFEYDYCGDCCLYPSCILLKACPTKQNEDSGMCQRSINQYCEDLEVHYQRGQYQSCVSTE